ncbi:phage holin family protein [Pontibacter sp. CAU 1760]
MGFIINVLVSAAVIMLMAYALSSVHIKSFGTALWVAFLVGLLNATIGWLLRGIFNLVSFFLLEAIVSLFVTAIVIKLVDLFVKNFKIDGFLPALLIALVTAIALALVGYLFGGNDHIALFSQQLFIPTA